MAAVSKDRVGPVETNEGTATVPQRNTLNMIVDVFASPGEAFASIRERPTVLVPILLVCIAAAAPAWLYLLEVDIGWLVERQLSAQRFIDLTDAQIETMANAAADRGRAFTIAQSVAGTFVFVTAFVLIQSLYLRIVSAFRKDAVRYKQWLSLVSWASLPAILGSIASIVFVLTNDVSFVEQTAINPLSFGNLLQLDPSNSSTVMTVARNLSPINVWSLVLVFLGYRAISGASLGTAAAVLLAPVLFIVAIVIALI
jgi:hypothetical protein